MLTREGHATNADALLLPTPAMVPSPTGQLDPVGELNEMSDNLPAVDL